jgi:beta-phosphoglucomutase-like phosphatase (HAD superfamily)
MVSAIIFDLDGVLADSEPWWSEIDAKLHAEHGVTYRGEHHRNVVGSELPAGGRNFTRKHLPWQCPLRK